MGLLNAFRFILSHPLNRGRKAGAILRYLRWQLGARVLPGSVVVPFVGDTRLVVSPGMTGATGNVYCGLHEFEDMALVLHALRPGDLFVDIGANVGSYTVLAAGPAGAKCVSIEPVSSTLQHLLDNIRLNGLESSVESRNIGLGGKPAVLRFTSALDTVNHVATAEDQNAAVVEVPVETLDTVLKGRQPTLIKIDVEGFETAVIDGAPLKRWYLDPYSA